MMSVHVHTMRTRAHSPEVAAVNAEEAEEAKEPSDPRHHRLIHGSVVDDGCVVRLYLDVVCRWRRCRCSHRLVVHGWLHRYDHMLLRYRLFPIAHKRLGILETHRDIQQRRAQTEDKR